ncbi:MAG: TorF family putative porin [Gammaproteobacteria bacterium]
MKKLVLLLAFFIISISNSFAIDRTVTVALTSNYVFRGQTQTDDKLAIQATYHAAQSKDKGWYAGMFASNVAKGAEVDLYGGWRAPFGEQQKLAFDVGAVQYLYTDSAFTESTYEIYGGISYETSYFRYFLGENSDYLDLSTSFYVLDEFGLELHYGRTFDLPNDGNDVGATLQKDIKGYLLAVSMTYEDVTAQNEFEFFVTVSKDFDL